MKREKYRSEDLDHLLEKIEKLMGDRQRPCLLVFDFDGVLSASEENRIYKLPEEPGESEELSKMAKAWGMNLDGYDVQYQRHLLFQAAASQLGLRIEPGLACSLARNASLKRQKVFVLSARSGIFAISRMHQFLEVNGIRPIEVFHVGRVTKEKQLALLLEKFLNQDVLYLEDEARHLDSVEVALRSNPHRDRLHLFEILDDSAKTVDSALYTVAWSVLRDGFESKLKGGKYGHWTGE